VEKDFSVHPKKTVRSGYEKIATRYASARKPGTEDVELLKMLIDRLTPGDLVIDAGCGSGYPVATLLTESFLVTGVDFAGELLRLAKERAPRAMLVCADITSLPFRNSTFDAVVSYYSIIHIPRDEHEHLLTDFYRILKPGGLVLLCMGAGDLPSDFSNW